jgi:hypothetical protein
MSTEAERLEREAERRRSSLDSTLDALKDRFSAGQIVDEVAAYVRNGQGAEMVQNLNRQVRDNPLALGLIGAGAAWLLLGQGARNTDAGSRYRSFDRSDDPRLERVRGREFDEFPTRHRDGSARHDLRDLGGHEGRAVASAASSAAAAVTGAASDAADAVASAVDGAAERARRLGHEASDAVHRAGDAIHREVSEIGDRVSHLQHRAKRTVLDTLQDEPLVLGALAVAIGAAIGAALPSTRVEDELLGETRDRVRDEVIDHGRDALHKAEVVATKVFDAASSEAKDEGLMPASTNGETVAEKVSSVVRTATSEAKDEAKNQGLL